MNRKDTKKAIEVMQAYVDGKEIITESGVFAGSPVWDWLNTGYHINPEPVERWIPSYIDIGYGFNSYPTKDQCDREYRLCANYKKAIKLVEAQDEN